MRLYAVLVLAALALTPGLARAQVVALRQVPERRARAAARHRLTGERQELHARYLRLADAGRAFNGRCASVDKGSAAAATCREMYTHLDAARRDYNAAAAAFNQHLATAIAHDAGALRAEVARLRKRLAAHQQALRNLGFETTAKQFEDYAALSEEGKLAAWRLATKAAVEVSFGAVQTGALKYRPVNVNQAKSIAMRLRGLGVTNPDVLDAAYNLHKLKPAEIKKFLGALKVVSLQVIAGATSRDAVEAAGEGIAATLYFFVKGEVGHRLVLGEMLANGLALVATYYEVSSGIAQMTRASDRQLEGLRPIQAMITTDTAALVAAKRDLARLGAAP